VVETLCQGKSANLQFQLPATVTIAGQGSGLRTRATVAAGREAPHGVDAAVTKRNRALVTEELGTSIDVLHRRYRQPILQTEAQRFWSLSPNAALSHSRDEEGSEVGQAGD